MQMIVAGQGHVGQGFHWPYAPQRWVTVPSATTWTPTASGNSPPASPTWITWHPYGCAQCWTPGPTPRPLSRRAGRLRHRGVSPRVRGAATAAGLRGIAPPTAGSSLRARGQNLAADAARPTRGCSSSPCHPVPSDRTGRNPRPVVGCALGTGRTPRGVPRPCRRSHGGAGRGLRLCGRSVPMSHVARDGSAHGAGGYTVPGVPQGPTDTTCGEGARKPTDSPPDRGTCCPPPVARRPPPRPATGRAPPLRFSRTRAVTPLPPNARPYRLGRSRELGQRRVCQVCAPDPAVRQGTSCGMTLVATPSSQARWPATPSRVSRSRQASRKVREAMSSAPTGQEVMRTACAYTARACAS